LGFEIDIHTGGVDNLYRHHDYTLAIMEGASSKQFCPWWLHGGHLMVNGQKMSKSKDNVTYVEDLLDQGFHPRHIRFFLLYGPYNDKLDLRLSQMEERAGHLDRIRRLASSLQTHNAENPHETEEDLAEKMRVAFEERMNDNLDFAGAFDAMADHLICAVSVDKKDGINAKSRNALLEVIRDIDRVFSVLGI